MYARCPDCMDLPDKRDNCQTCGGLGMVNLRKDGLAEWLFERRGETVRVDEVWERLVERKR